MFYDAMATSFWVLSSLLGLLALRSVIKGTCFWSFFRAVGLVTVIGCAVFFALLGWDVKHYKSLRVNEAIATVSFEMTAPQTYIVQLILNESGQLQEFYLRGDQWQVDARIIKWKGMGEVLGAKPGYRLDRISGRYYSVHDEMRKDRTVYSLLNNDSPIDFWGFAYKNSDKTPLFEATYGSATYLPMAAGAQFQIKLSSTGLLAVPINDNARRAVQTWSN